MLFASMIFGQFSDLTFSRPEYSAARNCTVSLSMLKRNTFFCLVCTFLLILLIFSNSHIQRDNGVDFVFNRVYTWRHIVSKCGADVQWENLLFWFRMKPDYLSKCVRNLLPLKPVSWVSAGLCCAWGNRTPTVIVVIEKNIWLQSESCILVRVGFRQGRCKSLS